MKLWTKLTPSDLREIANEVGVSIFGDTYGRYGADDGGFSKDGRAWNFRLALKTDEPAKKKEHGSWQYQRIGHSGRKVAAVCWHGHRDFMLAVFDKDEDARFKTAFADYRGKDDFMSSYPETAYRNIGSMMEPMRMSDACTCRSSTWLIDLSDSPGMSQFKMQQSSILKCPHVIIDPTHYRADGSCKCDDPAEQDRMIEEWGYSRSDFA